MQRINNIEIKNFKSIRHQRIDDCKRINVFIGYPNVGKSNILEAIGVAAIDASHINSNISDIIRIEDSTSVFFNGDTTTPFEVILDNKFRVKAEYQKERIIVQLQWNPTSFPFKEIDSASIHFDWKKDGNIEEVELQSMGGFSIEKGKMFDYNKTLTYDFVSKQKIRFPNIKRYIFNDKAKFTEGDSIQLEQPYGENIFSILSGNESLRKDVTDLFRPFDLRFPFDKSTKSFKILKDVGDDIFIISYRMIADTLRRLIFYKTAIATAKDSVLVFEEPEAQMFPPYIKKLTTDILMDKGDNQFFIATHSPYVLDELIEESEGDLAVYVVDYDKGETIIKRLTDEQVVEVAQYGIDLFFNLEPYLDKNG